jgi:hypothetical protein
MPQISRFFGIVITMNYSEHPPPHFHARYGGQKAIIAIGTLTLLRGKLSPRAMGMVIEWATLNQDALLENWQWARQHEPLRKIEPLE